MSNAIPLLEGTDGSGGYLVRDTYGANLQNTLQRESAALSLARVDRVPGKRQKYTVYAGRPTAAFVDEAAAKGVSGAEFTEVTVDVKKIATIVLYTQELIEDAREDPTVLVNADVEGAFADLIDAHIIGLDSGSAITGQFNSELVGTTQSVEIVLADDDALANAVSSAMQSIEEEGGNPNGLILSSDARAHIRAARGAGDNASNPLYTEGFTREPDSLYGLNISYSSNLNTFAEAAGAGKVLGIVGDFNHLVVALRKDITVRRSEQATVDVGGTLHHLFQQNKVALLWEMRVGAVAHDLNRMFTKILNAS